MTSASEAIDHRTEFVTVIYKDKNGCYQNTNIVQGEQDSVTYKQGEELLSQAERQGGTPVATLHTHNYPTGSEYDPGLTGTPGDQNRTHGDTGFAEKHDIPAVAIDVGPEAQHCAHGYDPQTNEVRSQCIE